MICTFFGHRSVTKEIEPLLRSTLINIIENHPVEMFYVGNQGAFDAMVRSTLRELKTIYPNIHYAVVLAYMPKKREEWEEQDDTILPEGIEKVPRRFAISWRNKWMLQQSDMVITYIRYSGGAAQFAEMAERKKKTVIRL